MRAFDGSLSWKIQNDKFGLLSSYCSGQLTPLLDTEARIHRRSAYGTGSTNMRLISCDRKLLEISFSHILGEALKRELYRLLDSNQREKTTHLCN
jgi:hypothetical protein